jgi:homocysteine S-methyltransferase
MAPIPTILQDYPVLVLDGALATELERRGCDLHDPLWSAKVLLETPDLIRQVHLDYFQAGADCAITASYQATLEGFAQRGLNPEKAVELIQLSGAIPPTGLAGHAPLWLPQSALMARFWLMVLSTGGITA